MIDKKVAFQMGSTKVEGTLVEILPSGIKMKNVKVGNQLKDSYEEAFFLNHLITTPVYPVPEKK